MDLDRFCKKIKNRKHDFATNVKHFQTMKNILTGLKDCGIAENVVVFMQYLMTFSNKIK